MLTMPALTLRPGCRIAWAIMLPSLLCAGPMAEPGHAQPAESAAQVPATEAPATEAPVSKPPASLPSKLQVPLVQAPVPLKVPVPVPAPAASAGNTPPAVPMSGSHAVVDPATKPQDKAAHAVPAAKPPQKSAPKAGPGVNDAGEAATSLRATRLSLISLIDRSVTGREKREIGHVIDVLVDVKGQPAALVVDVGGFMGMGNRRIAIAWESFALAGRKPNDALQLPLSDAQVKAAPAYDGTENVTLVQGAIEPAAGKSVPPATAPVKAHEADRVDLGEGLEGSGKETGNQAVPPADPLNPD